MTLRLLILWSAVCAATSAQDFDRDVRPILSDHCYACHGPDEASRQGGVRLDTRAGLASVVVEGDAGASPLIQRIRHADPSERMPPSVTKRALSSEQIAVLAAWVDAGATWSGHWAFRPPRKLRPPTVNRTVWPRGPIDRFVLARMEEHGLSPSGEAPRRVLLRRAALDLTGLPPTPEALRAFESDEADGSYERAVDRLLASPRFGEHMAARWLEAARYADTSGYQADWERHMWPWRDWVIAAFNKNMPFDRFTIEQLAGDLLPDPTLDQRVATAFNRNHRINDELGSLDAEFQVEYVVDRVDTTSTVWLGLTMACARCHDHKYDPISMADYYATFAFFNRVPEKGVDGRKGHSNPAVVVRHPDPSVHGVLARAERAFGTAREAFVAEDPRWKALLTRALPELRVGEASWAKKAPRRIRELASKDDMTAAQRKAIAQHVRRNHPDWARRRKSFDAKKKARDLARRRAFLNVMVMEDAPKPRPTYLLRRGAYDQPDRSREITAAVPPALGRLRAGHPVNRLGFARWLVGPEHPLTARVTVNRFWMHLFGRGIVATPEDFGTQGARPTHPDLLDWLSVEFIESGWDVKAMLRSLVTSATYRQSSHVSIGALDRDPLNRWLSRAPRFRLSAFQLRDQALFASGLMAPAIGGPSVKPYQPPGLWAEISFQDKKRSTDFYRQGTGADLHRRSLYTFWKRSVNPPFMTTFDAATREACSVRFSRTNTPLQSLNLLNDVTFVEAAKHLAIRVMREPGSPGDRIAAACALLGLRADPAIMEVLSGGHAAALEHYRRHPKEASAWLAFGQAAVPQGLDAVEVAAVGYVTMALLNLDATVTRE